MTKNSIMAEVKFKDFQDYEVGNTKVQNLVLVLNRGIMIHFWSIEMFLQDADMSYLSYPTYILNILYIAL